MAEPLPSTLEVLLDSRGRGRDDLSPGDWVSEHLVSLKRDQLPDFEGLLLAGRKQHQL